MKLALISVTRSGARLAERLAGKLGDRADLFAKNGRGESELASGYDSLSGLVGSIYNLYDGLVFIMATGIVVRVLAPHIRDKRFDPAVVVMDEAGENAISLLSGHIGGANELARLVAAAVGARPVITTATDVAQKPAADILAVRLGLEIEPFQEMKTINAAIVNGDRVGFFLDSSLANHESYACRALDEGVVVADIEQLNRVEGYDAAVVITDKDLYMVKPHIFLRPGTLAVGIGCRRGTTGAEIYTAIAEACRQIGRSPKSIAVIGTTVAKEDEIGLLAVAQQMAIPLECFANEELQDVIDEYGLDKSEFVQAQIGVGNVCEAAALLAGQADKLLLGRTVFEKVTVAIAEVRSRSWESAPEAWTT